MCAAEGRSHRRAKRALGLLALLAAAMGAQLVWAAPGATLTGAVTILDANGVPVADHGGIVVFLDGITVGAPAKSSSQQISQAGVRFSPRTLSVVVGQSVDFLNDDSSFHNVFSLSKAKPFDLGIYPKNTSKSVEFDKPGLVRVYCNIHPNMVSNVLVLTNEYFSSTDTNGRFEISDVPTGAVTVRVWSEFTAEQSRTVTVSGPELQLEPFVLTRNVRKRAHTNKFGKPYKGKYR